MDYEKKYDEALRRAKADIDIAADKDLVKGVATTIFPELRESEEERIRKALVWHLKAGEDFVSNGVTKEECITYLEKKKELDKMIVVSPEVWEDAISDAFENGKKEGEKQKEQKDYRKLYEDIAKSKWFKRAYDGKSLGCDDEQKEQKPTSTEDMPYITDERFYEREPADSFKYKLAEYMTKCCTKKEGPYGYTYGISAESILQMAKEELIKRGELKEQKPAWSEEDDAAHTRILGAVAKEFMGVLPTKPSEEDVDWLKTLPERFNLQPKQEQPEVDLNGKVTFDNKTILRVETDEKKKRVLEIIGLEESCCNYPLNYENETDDCYYEEYNDRIYIDGNITFNQMREIVEYIENK